MATSKKTISDVDKPGTTPADATSRPVIVGHGPTMKDPMVTADTKDTDNDTPSAAKLRVAPKKVIAPLSPEEASVEETPQEPVSEEVDPEKSESTKETPAKTEPAKPESPKPADDSASDSAVVDAVLDQANVTKHADIEDNAAVKRQELVNKLVAEKKYFVPLATAQHRRNNKIAIIVLAATLPLIVGGLLAVDAGIIETNVQLPFDLIK